MARTVTGHSLILGVFRLLGITAQGESPTSPEIVEAFDRLNELLDAWAIDRLLQRVVERSTYALVASQGTYTLGPTGTVPTPDWIGAYPTTIDGVAWIIPGSSPATEIPLSDLTLQAYQGIAQKDLTAAMPTAVMFDLTMPAATFTFWPVPDAVADVAVYAATSVVQFATLTTPYVMAPGYVRALRYALAMEIAAEYGATLTPEQMATARESLSAIKAVNVPMMDLALDAGLTPNTGSYGYSIRTDVG